MSNNYYIHTADGNMAFDLLPRVEMSAENREFTVHLCQTFMDLKPLFESHSYSTFKELRNILLDSNYTFTIQDEYGIIVEPSEFIERMERLNRNGKPREDQLSTTIADEDGFLFCDYSFD